MYFETEGDCPSFGLRLELVWKEESKDDIIESRPVPNRTTQTRYVTSRFVLSLAPDSGTCRSVRFTRTILGLAQCGRERRRCLDIQNISLLQKLSISPLRFRISSLEFVSECDSARIHIYGDSALSLPDTQVVEIPESKEMPFSDPAVERLLLEMKNLRSFHWNVAGIQPSEGGFTVLQSATSILKSFRVHSFRLYGHNDVTADAGLEPQIERQKTSRLLDCPTMLRVFEAFNRDLTHMGWNVLDWRVIEHVVRRELNRELSACQTPANSRALGKLGRVASPGPTAREHEGLRTRPPGTIYEVEMEDADISGYASERQDYVDVRRPHTKACFTLGPTGLKAKTFPGDNGAHEELKCTYWAIHWNNSESENARKSLPSPFESPPSTAEAEWLILMASFSLLLPPPSPVLATSSTPGVIPTILCPNSACWQHSTVLYRIARQLNVRDIFNLTAVSAHRTVGSRVPGERAISIRVRARTIRSRKPMLHDYGATGGNDSATSAMWTTFTARAPYQPPGHSIDICSQTALGSRRHMPTMASPAGVTYVRVVPLSWGPLKRVRRWRRSNENLEGQRRAPMITRVDILICPIRHIRAGDVLLHKRDFIGPPIVKALQLDISLLFVPERPPTKYTGTQSEPGTLSTGVLAVQIAV
ncbi:hypothetical protein C8R44DRAFT_945695 [Mycena epipterygia]|nr:hypothetical protein C8R44DRAFT_945695 [Mycena epipterygia]